MRGSRTTAASIAGLLGAAVLLTGCAGGEADSTSSAGGDGLQATGAAPAPESLEDATSQDSAGSARDGGTSGTLSGVTVERSVIAVADLTLRTEDVAAAVDTVQSVALSLGGYVSGQDVSSSPDDPERSRATVVVRVPTAKLETAIDRMQDAGELVRVTSDAQGRDRDRSWTSTAASRALAPASSGSAPCSRRPTTIGEVVRIESELARREADLEALLATAALARRPDRDGHPVGHGAGTGRRRAATGRRGRVRRRPSARVGCARRCRRGRADRPGRPAAVPRRGRARARADRGGVAPPPAAGRAVRTAAASARTGTEIPLLSADRSARGALVHLAHDRCQDLGVAAREHAVTEVEHVAGQVPSSVEHRVHPAADRVGRGEDDGRVEVALQGDIGVRRDAPPRRAAAGSRPRRRLRRRPASAAAARRCSPRSGSAGRPCRRASSRCAASAA